MPNYPATGGGPNSGPGLNPLTIYCAPDGNDNNDGLTVSASMRTGYAGYAKIAAAGGGILHLAQNTNWGGPVADQGIWLRGDGATIPGWQPAVPCVITGAGTSAILFQKPGAAVIKAGATVNDTYAYRKKPGVWIVKTSNRIRLDNLVLFDYMFQPIRIAMDYNRNSDGSVQNITVTNAVRSGAQSTYTVTLPAGYPISNLTRVSNVVTATVPAPSANQTFPPWRAGQKVYINSTDPGFASGEYEVISCVANLDSSTSWNFTYAETAADDTATNPGNVQSHGCSNGEYLDLDSNTFDFPPTQYQVVSHTYNTITVADPWGGELDNQGGTCPAMADDNDIGTLVHQERVYTSTMGTILDNVSFKMPVGPLYGLYFAGPGIDSGCPLAIGLETDNSQWQGLAFGDAPGPVAYPRDDDRMAALFMSPGSTSNGVEPALQVNNCTSADGGVRVIAGTNGATVVVNNLIGEVASTITQPPAVDVVGNFYTKVYVDYAIVADIDPALPNVRVTGAPAQSVVVKRSGLVDLQTTFGNVPYTNQVQRTVGVAQGEITLGSANGNAIEFFDANQNSLGAAVLLDFTVNP